MALGMVLSPIGGSTSHNPIALVSAETSRHAELAAQVEENGHADGDGVADEQSPGHDHGHNQADHTHETASAAPDFAQPVNPIDRMWHAHPPSFVDLDIGFRLERPPRPIVIA